MILGTTLRQGRRITSHNTAILVGRSLGIGDGRIGSVAASISTAFEPMIPRAQQKRAHTFSSSAPGHLATDTKTTTSWRSPIQLIDKALPSPSQTNVAVKGPNSEGPASEPTEFRRALSPSLRSVIVADLRSADLDGNGRIDARDLRALLRKHGDSFTEGEILELSELFYTGLGASSVGIDEFLEALDAAATAPSVANGKHEATNNGGAGVGSLVAGEGRFKTHPLGIGTCASEYMYAKTHGKYSEEDLNISLTHLTPVSFTDKTALFAVKCVRFAFDTATLWNVGSITKEKILNRAIFLETIAAIPGMVAAIIRHFRSLRNMTRDGGMLNMFLEEANNERMHLLTFIRMKEPGYLFRAAVVAAQFGFGGFFLTAYAIHPTWCHRFVGYIEEEACHTYTKILEEMEGAPAGSALAEWKAEAAPRIAKGYWHLGEHGTVYDVVKAVRADEAEHRDVNHAVSGVPDDTVNPLYDPRVKLDGMLKKYVMDIMEKEASKQANVA